MPTDDFSPEAIRRGLSTHALGQIIRFYPEVASTQDIARSEAQRGAPHGTAIIADLQHAGRGRMGRSWIAPAGTGLLLSIVLRPPENVYPRLFMIAALAAAEAVEETTGLRSELKWPNDVLLRDKKAGGVLVETEFEGEQPVFAVAGIGLNVNMSPDQLPSVIFPPTSLAIEAGHPVSRVALAQSLFVHFEQRLVEAAAHGPVADAWRARLTLLGKRIEVRADDRVERGIAEDVTDAGELILLRDDGSRITLAAGDVTLQV